MGVNIVRKGINKYRVAYYFMVFFFLISFSKFHKNAIFHVANNVTAIVLFLIYMIVYLQKKIRLTSINVISIVYLVYIYTVGYFLGTLSSVSEPFIIITLVLFTCYSVHNHEDDFFLAAIIFYVFFGGWQLYLEFTHPYLYSMFDSEQTDWLIGGKNYVVRTFLPGMMFILLYSAKKQLSIFNPIVLLPLLILTGTIILATSATGILGVLIFIVLAILFRKGAPRYISINLFLIGTIAVYLMILIFNIQERFEDFLILLGKNQSLSVRTEVWKYAIKGFLSNPLFGLGYGADVIGDVSDYHHAHQYWLNSLMTTGIIGTAMQLLIYLKANKNLNKQGNKIPEIRILIITIASFLFMGIDESLANSYMLIPILNLSGINFNKKTLYYNGKSKKVPVQ